MRTITQIQNTTARCKCKVFEEGELLFSLYPSELLAYGISENTELTDEVYQRICSETLLPRAKKRVLNLLLLRDRSQNELLDRLKEDGYPSEVASEAVAFAQGYHYVDDLRLAVTYLRAKQETKSTQYLKLKLMEKKIAKDIISEAFEQVREERMELMGESYEEAERTALAYELQKKLRAGTVLSEKERHKLYCSMCSKGFRARDVAEMLQMDCCE